MVTKNQYDQYGCWHMYIQLHAYAVTQRDYSLLIMGYQVANESSHTIVTKIINSVYSYVNIHLHALFPTLATKITTHQ